MRQGCRLLTFHLWTFFNYPKSKSTNDYNFFLFSTSINDFSCLLRKNIISPNFITLHSLKVVIFFLSCSVFFIFYFLPCYECTQLLGQPDA